MKKDRQVLMTLAGNGGREEDYGGVKRLFHVQQQLLTPLAAEGRKVVRGAVTRWRKDAQLIMALARRERLSGPQESKEGKAGRQQQEGSSMRKKRNRVSVTPLEVTVDEEGEVAQPGADEPQREPIASRIDFFLPPPRLAADGSGSRLQVLQEPNPQPPPAANACWTPLLPLLARTLMLTTTRPA